MIHTQYFQNKFQVQDDRLGTHRNINPNFSIHFFESSESDLFFFFSLSFFWLDLLIQLS